MPKIRQLQWQPLAMRLGRPGDVFLLNLVRLPRPAGPTPGYHRHDFAELFFVTGGSGTHRHAGGITPLKPGSAAFLRPEHAHAVEAAERRTLQFINLNFPAEQFALLEEAFPDVAGRFWPKSPAPLEQHWPEVLLQRMQAAARALATGTHNRSALFHFLLEIDRWFSGNEGSPFGMLTPRWLREAFEQFSRPEHFSQGVRGLAALAGCAPETISRVVRRETGGCASALVNRLRMEHAARELRMTDRPILDILLECGFSGASQFYKRFQDFHHLSPSAYRRQFSGIA